MRAYLMRFGALVGLSSLGVGTTSLPAQDAGKPPAARKSEGVSQEWKDRMANSIMEALGVSTPRFTARDPRTTDEIRWSHELEARVQELTAAGRLEEALKTAVFLTELDEKGLGDDHWRTVNARWDTDALRRVLKLDEASRQAFAALHGRHQRAAALEASGRYKEARPLREEDLATRRRLFGEEHPEIATGYNNLAANLDALGDRAEAEKLLRKSLDLRRRLMGEENAETALAYSNLAVNLSHQGRFAEAEEAYRKALMLLRRLLGDTDPWTVNTFESLAHMQTESGRYAEAERGYRFALTVYRRLRGEEDPKTIDCYQNLGGTLFEQGIFGEAEEYARKALALRRQVLGEESLGTAESLKLLGAILERQCRYAEAEPYFARSLDLYRRLRGEADLGTAEGHDLWAKILIRQGRYREAEESCRAALELYRTRRGEEHRDTAQSYDTLAMVRHAQGRYAEAESLERRALKSFESLLKRAGGDGPVATHIQDSISISCQNLATALDDLGRYAEAEEFLRRALELRRRLRGEEHPRTVNSYNMLALNLYRQGRYAEAEGTLRKAADAFLGARDRVAATGLNRAAFNTSYSSLPVLAALLARNGKPEEAWQWLQRGLACGIAADLMQLRHLTAADRDRRAALARRLEHLNDLIDRGEPRADDAPTKKKQYDAMLAERRRVKDDLDLLGYYIVSTDDLGRVERLEELAKVRELQRIYGPAAPQVFDRAAMQAALSPDTALIAWVDFFLQGDPSHEARGEHWAALLRAKGPPIWVRLEGSGDRGDWTNEDDLLPEALRAALSSPRTAWRPLAEKMRRQRLDPLRKYLAAGDGQPAVSRLVVLHSSSMAGVPIEVLADDLTVSYAPSGTLYAQQRQEPPALGVGLFALGDPAFEGRAGAADPKTRRSPPGGLLLTVVAPGSVAAVVGLRPGDVLLRYGSVELGSPDALAREVATRAKGGGVALTVWREAGTSELSVPPGDLGVVVAGSPASDALAGRRQSDHETMARVRNEGPAPLPGTRVEVEALRRLFTAAKTSPTLLTDLDASAENLGELARSGALSRFRYLHLATHGFADDRFPLRSAIILARAGRVSADHILSTWQLHADLVTLSACQTALGKHEVGEGFIGFTQALLLAGSRSVCLSLWPVDDAATALLMDRFYQNLLGRRDDLEGPMPKAAALAEAKAWLRSLPRDEALRRIASLRQGVARGKGRPLQPLLPEVPTPPRAGEPPYSHPFYWAAFILAGDPG